MELSSENAIADFTKALEANNRVMNKLLNHLEKQATPWVDPDEAAQLLGLPISKSGNHRRKVAYLAKHGFIKRYRSGRPYQYWRDDVVALQPKIANGEVLLPSRV